MDGSMLKRKNTEQQINRVQTSAEVNHVEISIKGRSVTVPGMKIGDRTIIVTGKSLRMAEIKDEAWLEGDGIGDPEACLEKIKIAGLGADIFTFSQKLPETGPKYSYPMEWDNVAAIPTSDYATWWMDRLPQETRKNVRRAERRGVIINQIAFSDELVQGIVRINNEAPIRQGRPYWHYGKSFERVKEDYATLLDRSEFIGAYYRGAMIGLIKMIYMGDIAAILQILSLNSHYDKRPVNALLARAVELCCVKHMKYLIYGKYLYGNNSKSPLTEFKRRNGFEQILVPKYYIPLTIKGRLAIQLKLHLGLKRLIPERVLTVALDVRSSWYERGARNREDQRS
jgi:hypothetical protein